MADLSWSCWGGEDCIRIGGVAADAEVRVHPRLPGTFGALPSTAGRVLADGGDLCFVPRFAFLDGTTYAVVVDGADEGDLVRLRVERPPMTEVLAIHPTAATVPRNLLRLYVTFSQPMSEGCAAEHVRLIDETGSDMVGALLPSTYELWNTGRRRLTVLLDPARIKRGLLPHREAGYPLHSNASFRIVVDPGFRDASGMALRTSAERRYEVGDDERRHVEPEAWTLAVPPSESVAALEVAFDRPLDRGLLGRCLQVVGPDGDGVDGTPAIGPEERSWRLVPRAPWAPGPHMLVVDPALEDLAGNSVSRVFDRDLTRPVDAPRPARPVTLPFRPR